MNRSALAKQLRIDEDVVYHVYLDTRGKRTAGVGHLLAASSVLAVGTAVTRTQVAAWLEQDIDVALQDCQALWPAFDTYPETVQQVLANMAFNLGRRKFSAFTDLRAAVQQRDWPAAAEAMVDSQWYREVKQRSRRLVARMRAVATQEVAQAKGAHEA